MIRPKPIGAELVIAQAGVALANARAKARADSLTGATLAEQIRRDTQEDLKRHGRD